MEIFRTLAGSLKDRGPACRGKVIVSFTLDLSSKHQGVMSRLGFRCIYKSSRQITGFIYKPHLCCDITVRGQGH